MTTRTGYIYKITNTVNGKSYIGQTLQTIQQRWYAHKYAAKKKKQGCKKLINAINKYGEESFCVEELWSGTGEEQTLRNVLNALEKAYIVYFNSIENGYNICRGGNGAQGHKVPGAEKHMDYFNGDYDAYYKWYAKEYCKKNSDKIKAYQKKYREEHKETSKQYQKEYYEKHKEQLRKANREWYYKNKANK